MRKGAFYLLLLASLALGQTLRLGLSLEGQLLPLGLAGFAEYRTAGGGLLRLTLGHDYYGPFVLGELGLLLQESPWERSWASVGGGYYFGGENEAFPFLLAGAGRYAYDERIGVWGGAMLPFDLLAGKTQLDSGAGLALFALLRVRVEVAEVEIR